MGNFRNQRTVKSIIRRQIQGGWETPVAVQGRMFVHGSKPKSLEILSFPNGRDWKPGRRHWKLPADWKEILLKGYGTARKIPFLPALMDICVRLRDPAGQMFTFSRHGDPKNIRC